MIHSGFSGSRSNGKVHNLDHNAWHKRPRISVFKRISYPRRSVFERLNFRAKVPPQEFQNLNGQQSALNRGSKGPYVSQPSTVVAGLNSVCKRCLSPNHPRISCQNQIKYWHGKQEGHVLETHRLFTGSQDSAVNYGRTFACLFSLSINSADWKDKEVQKWFKQPTTMTSGPQRRNYQGCTLPLS